MSTVRVNFTIPEQVASRLKLSVHDRSRSAFIVEAIKERLDKLEKESFRQLLTEGYQARREEDREINQEWEAATLERWT